MRDCK